MLSFYEVRLGCIADVHVETRSRHEMRLLRDYDASESALTRHRQALWLVDRAFIDAAFWNRKKKHAGITIITRMKSSLRVDSTEDRPVPEVPVNEGVVKDLRITLRSSRAPWRLITYHTRRGHQVEFLTNEFALAPGLIAFLSSRRWEEEKCFDTGKNDFSLAKAWGASPVAIANQARLAMVTSLLVALFVHRKMGPTALPMRRRCANRTSGKPPTPTEPTVPIGVPPSSATHPRSAAKCFGSSNTVSISQLPRRSMIATYGHYYWRTYDGEPDTVAAEVRLPAFANSRLSLSYSTIPSRFISVKKYCPLTKASFTSSSVWTSIFKGWRTRETIRSSAVCQILYSSTNSLLLTITRMS